MHSVVTVNLDRCEKSRGTPFNSVECGLGLICVRSVASLRIDRAPEWHRCSYAIIDRRCQNA